MTYATILVFAYQNGEKLHPVNVKAPYYREDKIVQSNYDNVLVYRNGFKMRYQVKVYKFRRVKNTTLKIEDLINFIKSNPGKYQGWIHHANIYIKVPKQHLGPHTQQLYLNFEL